MWKWDIADGSITLGAGTMERYGWDIDDVAVPVSWFQQRIHPEDIGAMLTRAEQVHAEGATANTRNAATHAFRFRRANGQYAMVHDHFHVIRDNDGKPLRAIGVMLDASERHALQEQLRQAQKMDAVGRLAGGIAHDFNNLLTVIRGNAALAMEDVDATHPLHDELTNIEQAAARATDLTRQLLAFSRKQVFIPQPLDVNAIVAQLTRLLDRLLPPTITVQLTPAAESGMIKTDRGQLEQVILNLVINARDAMPNGGSLIVRTDEFTIGGPNIHSLRRATFRFVPVTMCICRFQTVVPEWTPTRVRMRSNRLHNEVCRLGHGTGVVDGVRHREAKRRICVD